MSIELAVIHPDALASRFASTPNSAFRTVNSAMPQSRQISSSGNIITAGFLISFNSGKRIEISALNLLTFSDPHDLQFTFAPPTPMVTRPEARAGLLSVSPIGSHITKADTASMNLSAF